MTQVDLTPAAIPVQQTSQDPTQERLPESASLLLDVFRFALALLVVVGHATLPWFSTAWPPLLGWADLAVPGFFVLSGFMIRYVTEDREREPARYFISRASRMYSVLVPALALTLLCRVVVNAHNPAFAALLWTPESSTSLAAHALAHGLFFTQFWGHAVLFSPNLPLWSLGYEVPYYLLFGLLTLCRGRWRWPLAALYVLALGPQVLFLAPLWWSGCWLYDLWQWSRRIRTREASVAAIATVLLLGLLLPLAGSPAWIRMTHLPNVLTLLGAPSARATTVAYASGLLAWFVMLLGLCASDTIRLSREARWAKPVRRAAEGTFTLYLFHYPLLCLFPAYLGHALRTGWGTTVMVGSIVAFSIAAAPATDALKVAMRRALAARLLIASRTTPQSRVASAKPPA